MFDKSVQTDQAFPADCLHLKHCQVSRLVVNVQHVPLHLPCVTPSPRFSDVPAYSQVLLRQRRVPPRVFTLEQL